MPLPDNAPLRLVEKRVDAEVVSDLEMLLERARAGDVHGLAWVAFCEGRCIASHYTTGMTDHLFTAIGSVQSLQQDLLNRVQRPPVKRL